MSNELLLVLNLIVLYSGVLIFYKSMGKKGLFIWLAIATILANIEVLLMVDAFGMEQTLGNIMFASTFVVTDIMSEVYGKKDSMKAVKVGVMVSIAFMIISQMWLMFTPASSDWAMESMRMIFSNTPRMMLAGLTAFGVSAMIDVKLYEAWWSLTEKMFKGKKQGLWIRNNGSTLLSQLVNTILFAVIAFWGVYDVPTLLNIVFASYIIFVATSILDTPVVYIARKMNINED